MYNFWFELKHALSLWRSYAVYLLLLPLLLAATLVMLHAGLILQQRAMAPMPMATANTASGFWSLGLQDDSFQTFAFNPPQLRQLTTVLQPDYQMATLAYSSLAVRDPVMGMQQLTALFLDSTLTDYWPEAHFLEKLEPDKILLSHSYARQLLTKAGALPELLEIDGLYFQVGGVVPADWPGLGHWQADVWLSASTYTTLLRQRLQKQYQDLPDVSSNLSVFMPSLLDTTAQFYLLIRQKNGPTESFPLLLRRLEALDLSASNSVMTGSFSIKITQRPQSIMLLPGVQFLPAMHQKTLEMSRLLLAQATLLLILTCAQLIILLLARHLQRRSEWQTRMMLGLPQQQSWYAIIAELLPVLMLTILFYTLLIRMFSWFVSRNPLFEQLLAEERASWLADNGLLAGVLLLVFVMLLLLQKVITGYLSEMSGVRASQFSTLLQRCGSVVITTGACFSLSLCLLNWQSLQQLTANPYISETQQSMHIYALQKAPNGYYQALAEDIRAKGMAVTLSSAAPLRPVSDFYFFSLANSTQDPSELGLIYSDHLTAEVLGLKLISGRWFSEFASHECVISSQALSLLDTEPATVLNRSLLNDLQVVGNCEIVGVVDDLKYGYLNEPLVPVVYKPVSSLAGQLYMLSYRDELASVFQTINSRPDAGIAEQWQLRALIFEQSTRERYFFRLTLLLSVFSILLYFGSQAVEQKLLTKRLGRETAIRAALGAGTYQLTLFLIRDPAKNLSATLFILILLLTLTLQQVTYFSLSATLITGNLLLMMLYLSIILPLLRQVRTNEIKALIQ